MNPLIFFGWQKKFLIIASAVLVFFILLKFWPSQEKDKTPPPKVDVVLPSIVGGDLLFPPTLSTVSGRPSNLLAEQKLAVNSINLLAVMDKDKITAVRTVGEVTNTSDKTITAVSPVVRFLDTNGKVVGQRVARPSSGYEFVGLGPQERVVYDYLVDNPPEANRVELVFNILASSDSAVLRPLKISNRAIETKSSSTEEGDQASNSATAITQQGVAQSFEYYTVSGKIVNPFQFPVTKILVYAWAKDKEGKVFSFGQLGFPNDLLSTDEKVDFKISLIPFRLGAVLDSYEVAAWGEAYRLGF